MYLTWPMDWHRHGRPRCRSRSGSRFPGKISWPGSVWIERVSVDRLVFGHPWLTPPQFVHGNSEKGMHDLAEREKHDKEVGKEDVQDQHKGMPGLVDGLRELGAGKTTGWSDRFDNLRATVPRSRTSGGPSPSERRKARSEKAGSAGSSLRERKVPGPGRRNRRKRKIEQGQGQDQPDKTLSQKDLVGPELEKGEALKQFQVADDQQQQGDMERSSEKPRAAGYGAGPWASEKCRGGPRAIRVLFGIDLQGAGRIFRSSDRSWPIWLTVPTTKTRKAR